MGNLQALGVILGSTNGDLTSTLEVIKRNSSLVWAFSTDNFDTNHSDKRARRNVNSGIG